MAHIQNRKSNFYSQKQSVRDELSAPQHLESAGDVLIKHLARKQTNTRTSLQEQLEIVQNFEKGFQLKPDDRKGISRLEEFKNHPQTHTDTPPEREQVRTLDELMRDTGLTRHELELGLSEKPNSAISQLYMFALGNKRQSSKVDGLTSQLPEHPINHLKEIEEECFGEKKKARSEESEPSVERRGKEAGGKKKHRKRRRKGGGKPTPQSDPPETPPSPKEQEPPKTGFCRPSLWDVRDMKKWSESKKVGCKPPALYTIKNGEIIKLGEERGGGGQGEDVT